MWYANESSGGWRRREVACDVPTEDGISPVSGGNADQEAIDLQCLPERADAARDYRYRRADVGAGMEGGDGSPIVHEAHEANG